MVPRSQPRGASQASALPSPRDFERHLVARAATVAPADVTALLAQGEPARPRRTGARATHPPLAQRARVPLHPLADHAHGACPQIPYQTGSMRAAALFYSLEPMDVVPDFTPRAGTA